MSEKIQPAVHLDPDTLSAFAENALPLHERQAAFAHLAICAHCRELLQLALPTVEEMQPIAVVPSRRGWRWLVLGVAACAGIGLASIALLQPHPQPASPVTTAKVEVPPAVQPKSLLADKQAPHASVPAPKSAIQAQPAALPSTPPPPPPALAPPAAPAAQASAAGTSAGVQALPQLARSAATPQPYQYEAAPPPPAASVRLATPAKPIAPNGLPAAASQSIHGAASAQPDASAISVNGAIVSTRNTELPSHLPIASGFTQGQRTIAADTAGSLFLSQDAGAHWSSVKAPWSGHVVRVTAAVTPALAQRFAMPRAAAATGNARLQGTIQDPTGAVISGAILSANGLRTTADRNGVYHFQSLAPGPYDLRAEAPGFTTTQLTLTLADAQQKVQNLTLQPAASNDAITVSADAPLATYKLIQLPPIFALTTSNGERWVSPDGTHWHRD